MRKCDHPNIIKMFEVFESNTSLHIILEYLGGGDLSIKLKERSIFNESDIRTIIRNVLEGLLGAH